MIKKQRYQSATIFLVLILLFSGGCKKSTPADPLKEEEPNLPGAMMTLSAISYVADGLQLSVIKDSITYLLSDKTLATQGNWKLVWGPVVTSVKGTLVFVAMNNTGEIPAYAIVIRGTNIHSLSDIVGDLNVFKLRHFTYGLAGDSVSRGGMEGLDSLLKEKDPANGANLEVFLKSLSAGGKIPLFVTGHSMGGALAPLMAYWLVMNQNLKDKFIFSTIAFAGPGIVNKSFRDNFLIALPSDASFKMMVNSLDVIPYFWSDLPNIRTRNIPVLFPPDYVFPLDLAETGLAITNISYYNIVTADTLGNIPISMSSAGGIKPSDTNKWYDHWVAVEHSHDNYLKLLGAKPLKPF